MIAKTKTKKGMRFVSIKTKIPQTNFDELTRLVDERNKGAKPEHHIDETYIVSELIMKHTQPIVTL